uniref:Uncharacterized protein n=1 Tax=Romanomermis culicivorax TaxID=13658 RepID=A0A915J769_ROMCU
MTTHKSSLLISHDLIVVDSSSGEHLTACTENGKLTFSTLNPTMWIGVKIARKRAYDGISNPLTKTEDTATCTLFGRVPAPPRGTTSAPVTVRDVSCTRTRNYATILLDPDPDSGTSTSTAPKTVHKPDSNLNTMCWTLVATDIKKKFRSILSEGAQKRLQLTFSEPGEAFSDKLTSLGFKEIIIRPPGRRRVTHGLDKSYYTSPSGEGPALLYFVLRTPVSAGLAISTQPKLPKPALAGANAQITDGFGGTGGGFDERLLSQGGGKPDRNVGCLTVLALLKERRKSSGTISWKLRSFLGDGIKSSTKFGKKRLVSIGAGAGNGNASNIQPRCWNATEFTSFLITMDVHTVADVVRRTNFRSGADRRINKISISSANILVLATIGRISKSESGRMNNSKFLSIHQSLTIYEVCCDDTNTLFDGREFVRVRAKC